jgi:hypothetical protein
MLRKQFYRDYYLQTGFLPMQPLTHALALGDVCQIHQGRILPLLNIAQARLVEPLVHSRALVLAPADISLRRDAMQRNSTAAWHDDGSGKQQLRTHQTLEFSQAGGFIFAGGQGSARLLCNWNEIRDDLTVKLTQLHYGFREVYVVTALVTVDQWALAVAAQPGASLKMSAKSESSDGYALLADPSARHESSEGMAVHEAGQGRPAHFFKARKLVLSDLMHDRYLNHLLESEPGSRPFGLPNWNRTSLQNLIRANELTLNTCIDFYTWVDLSLDDIERLAG